MRTWFKITLAALLVTFVAADAMAARKVRATGFYRWQVGTIALPAQFVFSAPGQTGNPDIFIGFPNPDPMFDGDATLVGKSPAAITLPAGIAMGTYSALLPIMGTEIAQITSNFMFSAPAAMAGAGMFSAGGGPGSFSFCPASTAQGLPGAACPLTTMGAPALSAAPQGTQTRTGRIVYMGGGGFGGVSRLLAVGSINVTRARANFGFGSPIFQASHVPITGSMTRVTGGGYGLISTRPNPIANFTQPKTAPTTQGTIGPGQSGPVVTSMGALTSCPSTTMGGAYPNIPLTGTLACVVGAGPPLTNGAGTSSQTAFQFTTGTVLVQQTTNNAANGVGHLFTLTGSDARTARGIGNISMVSGMLASGITAAAVQTTAFQNTISMTISEKAPSMTTGGLAAAALLMVLGAGYALRRRF